MTERLNFATLRAKLDDTYDFALQLGLSVPSDLYDMTALVEAIDQARVELRFCLASGGAEAEGPGSSPRGGLEVPR